jgi:uncharacterized protein YfcZ (UPF0381/DUF406 family)
MFNGEAGAMTVKREIRRGAIFACAVLAALFIGKLATGDEAEPPAGNAWLSDSSASFSMARKNYASLKYAGGTVAPVDAQKYEKVATVGESTSNFDADRAKVESLIASSGALTQYEQQQGLSGRRTLQLGIGVPPSQFDSFVEESRKIAKLTYLAIVKTDKTNEYRQLRARKETLEKSRKTLAEMAASGGSVDERLKVQAKLTEVEDKLQDLGVSLGDFNAENEFCTVKLTLAESGSPLRPSLVSRAFHAFTWALEYFVFLAFGFVLLALALWLASLAVGALAQAWTRIANE